MVCITDGPTAQNLLGHLNQFVTESPSIPPVALSTILGKNAARAIPIWSFASATRRSAAAMSGRRSRSCEGKPTEISGGWNLEAIDGKLNAAGGFPISTAIACSNCARCTVISVC